jgi:hypothetical protein
MATKLLHVVVQVTKRDLSVIYFHLVIFEFWEHSWAPLTETYGDVKYSITRF